MSRKTKGMFKLVISLIVMLTGFSGCIIAMFLGEDWPIALMFVLGVPGGLSFCLALGELGGH